MYNIGTDKTVGLVQDCSTSIANALEILQSYTQPPKWFHLDQFHYFLYLLVKFFVHFPLKLSGQFFCSIFSPFVHIALDLPQFYVLLPEGFMEWAALPQGFM